MNIIKKTIEFYCNAELESFKSSIYYSELSGLSNKAGFCFKYGVVPPVGSQADKIKALYLYFDIVDKDKKTVEFNECPFSFSTVIVCFSKKGMIKFSHWEEDEDFIDTIVDILIEFKKRKRFE